MEFAASLPGRYRVRPSRLEVMQFSIHDKIKAYAFHPPLGGSSGYLMGVVLNFRPSPMDNPERIQAISRRSSAATPPERLLCKHGPERVAAKAAATLPGSKNEATGYPEVSLRLDLRLISAFPSG